MSGPPPAGLPQAAPPYAPPPYASPYAGPPPYVSSPYAGFWRRFLAALIDGVALLVLQGLMFAVFAGLFAVGFSGYHFEDDTPETALAAGGLGLLVNAAVISVNWLYMALQESSGAQATLGKRALGMRVTDMAGRRISFGRATGRYFAKFISSMILLIGFVMIAFTGRKQGLHDMIAETLVLKS